MAGDCRSEQTAYRTGRGSGIQQSDRPWKEVFRRKAG